MAPGEPTPALTLASFAAYPPQARQLAADHAALLARIPLLLRVALLREMISYDWKFPAERADIEAQLRYLAALPQQEWAANVGAFDSFTLTPELAQIDWINDPQAFIEQLTAHLWATSQMDNFHKVADSYAAAFRDSSFAPRADKPSLSIVVLGQGVEHNTYPLFRKLRPEGVHFTRIKPDNGLDMLLAAAVARARSQPTPYSHWYVDGGASLTGAATTGASLTTVSFAALAPVRQALTSKMSQAAQSGAMGPEGLRTLLARLRPADLGLSSTAESAVLNHFQVSLLTEGSGTQVFSTTFAQWAARELYRRAQPETLLLRFAPRRRSRPLNELLASHSGAEQHPDELDPRGSLIDADMAAYYTWINQKRVSSPQHATFLAWFEGHDEAFAISPSLPKGTQSSQPADLAQILKWMA